MITTERISSWLREPHQLQEISPRALLQLVNQYPYFTPAHYLKLLALKQYDTDASFALKQSHPVNPVLLGYLAAAAQNMPIAPGNAGVGAATPVDPLRSVETGSEIDIVMPVSAQDYFLQQGIEVPDELPVVQEERREEEKEKSLMVVMSFAEWLNFIHSRGKKEREEEEDQRALKTMWQKQKLAAAIEEESDEIPEQVFEMAVNSISKPNELISESLAEIYVRQGKKEKAIEMYRKLSLQNPEKNTYFAAKIENLQKDI